MKKTVITGLLLAFAVAAKAQWFNLVSPVSVNLYSTCFTSADTGYAVGGDINSSVFLKTVDGGAGWSTITNTQTKWLYDVIFLNDTLGIACGYEGAIYKTTNAGASWTSKPSQTTAWLYAMASRPDGVLYAVGTDGAMVKSTNLGDNWNPVTSNTGKTMLDIQFYDNLYGSAVGYNGEMIYTTDGGNNWAVKLMGTPGNMTGVWMQSPDTIFITGYMGRLYKTTNAGQSFVLHTLGTGDLNSVYFTDDHTGYLCGYQVIYQTSDGGTTWNPMVPLPTSATLRDIYVLPDNVTMYSVGSGGSILKNINTIGINEAGNNDLHLYPNPCISGFTLLVNGTGSIDLVDQQGNRVKSMLFTGEEENTWFSTEDIAPGTYFVHLQQAGKTSAAKIIVYN